ncbi:hypothetical protein VMCG_07222 [Cytospora schulzeri]|uniref:C2H2-type domain-containing protein n=1 Tax=Cytospora schulzeri TaxID=448051 RepID=A0A423WAK3_9PEZI|nr:hypothetical protein VMCG_07222 [Valsa malicola]
MFENEKETPRSPPTSDTSDAPSPLRRFAKHLRENAFNNAVREKPRHISSRLSWNILAKRRKSTRDDEELTDKKDHRIMFLFETHIRAAARCFIPALTLKDARVVKLVGTSPLSRLPDAQLASIDSKLAHDDVRARPYSVGHRLGEREEIDQSPDGASSSPSDCVRRFGGLDTTDGASHIAAGIKPNDTCSYINGEDVSESRKSAEEMNPGPGSTAARSLGSVDSSEGNSSLDTSSVGLSEDSDGISSFQHLYSSSGAEAHCLRLALDGWNPRCRLGADSHTDATSVTGTTSLLPEEQRVSTKRKRTTDRKDTFACPYSKKDPVRHRDCYGYVLSRVRDVKQHLNRCHKLPHYCPRCNEIFDTEALRDSHNMLCTSTTRAARPDGTTEEQRRQLSRKAEANTSMEDQWFGVWDILFPGTQRPKSPYNNSDLIQDITLFQEFLATSGLQFLSNVLVQRGVVMLSGTQQAALEEWLQVVFEEWRRRCATSGQWSRATSCSPESAGQDATSSSDFTEREEPPQVPLTVPQTNPMLSTGPAPYVACPTGYDGTPQTDLLTTNEPNHSRAEVLFAFMDGGDNVTRGRPEHASFHWTWDASQGPFVEASEMEMEIDDLLKNYPG